MTHDDRPLITLTDLCERLNVSRQTIYRLVKRGELHPVRISEALRFVPADIDEYVYREWNNKNGHGA